MRISITTLAGASALLLLTACGGGGGSSTPSGPTYATSLSYTNPTSGTYQLVQDPASSGGTLVLDVVGATPISGISFGFTASGVTWTNPIANGPTFNLGTTAPLVTKVTTGNELQGALCQNPPANVTTPGTQVLAKITMKLKANVPPGTLTLTSNATLSTVLVSGTVSTITINVGTLKAQ